MKRKLLAIILVFALILSVSSGIILFFKDTNKNVAKVGNEKITEDEFQVFLKVQKDKLLSENEVYDQTETASFWESEIDGKSTKTIVKERTLEKLQELKIQVIKAKENGMKLDEQDKEDIKLFMNDLKVSMSADMNKSEIDRGFIELYGVGSKAFEEAYTQTVLARKFVSLELNNSNFTDEQIKEYYEKNKDIIDELTIRQIIIATVNFQTNEALSETKQQEASVRAYEIYNKVKNGEDMQTLAIDYSDDPDVSKNEGIYTFIYSGNTQSSLEQWAVAANVGDVEVILTSFGYHVLRLEKRTGMEEGTDYARSDLFEIKYIETLNSWKNNEQFKVILNQRVYDSLTIN